MNFANDSRLKLHQLLKAMVEKGASDLHLTAGAPPYFRIDGQVLQVKLPPLAPEEIKELCYSLISEEQKIVFEKNNELDFSFMVKNVSRFRANYYVQQNSIAAAIRTIPFKILSAEELGLPPVVAEIANKPNGLVLVTGPTGSGKSTTLASIIDKINSEQRCHIMTIEDPIEFVHMHKLSIVNQREVGRDTDSFGKALKYVLRQDPDVVLVGEMRDLETIEAALTISETGHLVFGTLHTNSAVSTVNRVIDVFPPHQQDQIRTKLSFVLQAVISQQLLPKAQGVGRAMALEIMMPNAAIRNLIREGKIHQIYGQMQVGQDKSGMQTLNQNLYNLVQRGVISPQDALQATQELDEFRMMLEGRHQPNNYKLGR
ncbi:MAG: type IV pilus twitching motility protein PilT [Polyangiaceae bacterium]